MIRTLSVALAAMGYLVAAVPAQAAGWQFRWQPGQELTYRVEQSTFASEVIEGKKTETKSTLSNVKHWQIADVDAAGVATVQLSLKALKIETTTPEGEVMVFDSANPNGSNPQLREQLGKFLDQTLAVLRIDAQGKVVEVKECKFGTPSRYESEPPFVIQLSGAVPNVNEPWERNYQITLDPPQGTGQKFESVQKYVCTKVDGSAATIVVATTPRTLPESLADQIPLMQMLPGGEVIFDVPNGRMQSAHLKIEKELKNHQGEGSSYQFQSEYKEELIGSK